MALPLFAYLTSCSEAEPRTFEFFMDDQYARDGTLARCNDDREGTLYEIECANARRAAAAIALSDERTRREQLEIESEKRLTALRAQVERERERARNARAAAEAAALAAYEAFWKEADRDLPLDSEAESVLQEAPTEVQGAGSPSTTR